MSGCGKRLPIYVCEDCRHFELGDSLTGLQESNEFIAHLRALQLSAKSAESPCIGWPLTMENDLIYLEAVRCVIAVVKPRKFEFTSDSSSQLSEVTMDGRIQRRVVPLEPCWSGRRQGNGRKRRFYFDGLTPSAAGCLTGRRRFSTLVVMKVANAESRFL